jgi:hypothetical protein
MIVYGYFFPYIILATVGFFIGRHRRFFGVPLTCGSVENPLPCHAQVAIGGNPLRWLPLVFLLGPPLIGFIGAGGRFALWSLLTL